ncbi:hypothetical protein CANINC_002400 [Pichia inconspicua]|uniref:Uncharacterized protein n=1 Tax=Pichia inconspicua TaxID=52247 RepID=A0A4T0X148_9ASCO|nr:hypothetical protein CANINC_002400 [[Candida] inconspicua]
MAATHKSKKQKKSSNKLNSYSDNIQDGNSQKKTDDFTFSSKLKTSIYSTPENIDIGKNPVFQFPIPQIEPGKANLMNDEVDMHFPRKHFFRKFQTNFELLDNIIMKPIPVNKIKPPTLFPSPIIDGTSWETKKRTLFDSSKDSNSTSATRKNTPKYEPNHKSNSNTAMDTVNEIKSETGKGSEEKDIKEETFDEDNLSDYDPDFESQSPKHTNELSEQQSRLVDAYINTRMQMKSSNDFYFGDLKTMKLQEQNFSRALKNIENSKDDEPTIGNHFELTKDLLNKLDIEFHNYTAANIEVFETKINEIESEIEKDVTYGEYEDLKKSKLAMENGPEKKLEPETFVSSETNDYNLTAKPEEKPLTDASAFDFENNLLYGPDLEAADDDDDAFGSLTNEMFFD